MPAAPTMSLAPGARVGPYEVTALLGVGGMGEVYRATDTDLGRAVAIKVIGHTSPDPERLSRFEREARLLASLDHPNVARIYGIQRDDNVVALVLELVEGETLADRLARGRLPLAEALSIARQLAEALHAAHALSIIHRDLKPANIKIAPSGVVKVLDFGLAKAIEDPAANVEHAAADTPTALTTRAGTILGTPAYMSPEQARGQSVDERTDIWAFGCVLYETLTNESPFLRGTATDTLAAVVSVEPDLTRLTADTPQTVTELLRRCLEKNQQHRLRDIREAHVALTQTTPAAASPPIVSRLHVRSTRSWVAVAAVLGALALASWLTWPRRSGNDLSAIRSLAVLPLKPLKADAPENYIGLGVADSIIMGVSRAGTLAVRPTSAVRSYATGNADALSAAAALGVDAVLDGTWFREGDRIRVAVNLIRVSDGRSLWAERFDLRAGDMFAIQDQLAGSIVAQLRSEITPPAPGAQKRGTQNPVAFDHYVKGRFYFGERGTTAASRERSDTATTLFEQAVAADPTFADAHAMLGFAYAWTAVFIEDSPALIEKATAETDLAESLGGTSGQVHLNRGFLLFTWYRGWRLAEAITEYRRAAEIDPSLSDNELGSILCHVGLLEECRAVQLRALDRDPTNRQMKLGVVNEWFLSGQADEALELQRRLFGSDQTPDVRYFLAKRRLADAERLIEAEAEAANDSGALGRLGRLRALQGRHAEAQATLTRLMAKVPRNRSYHHATYSAAQVRAQSGNVADTARWLNETINNGFPSYPLMASDPWLDPVRSAPEIQAILARLKVQLEMYRKVADTGGRPVGR